MAKHTDPQPQPQSHGKVEPAKVGLENQPAWEPQETWTAEEAQPVYTEGGSRNVADIQADLDAARAKLRELHPRVEGDHRKKVNQAARIEAALAKWRVERPDEPFDPEVFNPPMHPYVGGEELQKEFHKQHYVVAALEQELESANKAQ